MTRRRGVQQEVLNAIIAAAVEAPNLSNLLEAVIDLTLRAVHVEIGAIWVPGQKVVRGIRIEEMSFHHIE